MPVLFNAAARLKLQLTVFSCSVGATFWCRRSLGVDITQAALQEQMVPDLVLPDLGLLDSSGATVARLLRDRFGDSRRPTCRRCRSTTWPAAPGASRLPWAVGAGSPIR